MPLSYAAGLIRRALPAIVLAAVLGLAVGWMAAHQTQTYATTANLALEPHEDQIAVRAVDPERFFQTQSQRILDDSVMAAAANRFGNGQTAADLRGMTVVGGGATDDIVSVSVMGDTADQSSRGLRVVIDALRYKPLEAADMTVLWTGPTQASVNRVQYLLGGTLGGAALAMLGALVAGAFRRPLLDARHVSLGDDRTEVYPLPVDRYDDTLVDWLAAQNPEQLARVVIRVDDRPATAALAGQLPQDQALPGAGRMLIFVASSGRTSEAQVEGVVRTRRGPLDRAILLITAASSSQLDAGARRADSPQTQIQG